MEDDLFGKRAFDGPPEEEEKLVSDDKEMFAGELIYYLAYINKILQKTKK